MKPRIYGLVLALLSLLTASVDAAPGARVATLDDALSAIDTAQRSIVASAFTLQEQQPFVQALRRAAARGVHVDLVLTGVAARQERYAIDQNCALLSSLGFRGQCGAGSQVTRGALRVELLPRLIHLKALVVDSGRFVGLDDQNFARHGTLVELDPSFALAVERAAVGDPHDQMPLTLTKGRSLALEAALIDHAQRSVVLESESFGGGNAVFEALKRASARHLRVIVIVADREAMSNFSERAALDELAKGGATVRMQHGTAKGTVIDGVVGWIGSSNATAQADDQIDWGYASTDPNFVQAVNDAIVGSTLGGQ